MRKSKNVQRDQHRPTSNERTVFITDLVQMLEDMIPDGPKSAGFDAAKWIARWLETPQPALGGTAPKDHLDTTEGRAIVRRLLGSIESGAYM